MSRLLKLYFVIASCYLPVVTSTWGHFIHLSKQNQHAFINGKSGSSDRSNRIENNGLRQNAFLKDSHSSDTADTNLVGDHGRSSGPDKQDSTLLGSHKLGLNRFPWPKKSTSDFSKDHKTPHESALGKGFGHHISGSKPKHNLFQNWKEKTVSAADHNNGIKWLLTKFDPKADDKFDIQNTSGASSNQSDRSKSNDSWNKSKFEKAVSHSEKSTDVPHSKKSSDVSLSEKSSDVSHSKKSSDVSHSEKYKTEKDEKSEKSKIKYFTVKHDHESKRQKSAGDSSNMKHESDSEVSDKTFRTTGSKTERSQKKDKESSTEKSISEEAKTSKEKSTKDTFNSKGDDRSSKGFYQEGIHFETESKSKLKSDKLSDKSKAKLSKTQESQKSKTSVFDNDSVLENSEIAKEDVFEHTPSNEKDPKQDKENTPQKDLSTETKNDNPKSVDTEISRKGKSSGEKDFSNQYPLPPKSKQRDFDNLPTQESKEIHLLQNDKNEGVPQSSNEDNTDRGQSKDKSGKDSNGKSKSSNIGTSKESKASRNEPKSEGSRTPITDDNRVYPFQVPKDKSRLFQWPPKNKSKPFQWPSNDKNKQFERPFKEKSKPFDIPLTNKDDSFPFFPKDDSHDMTINKGSTEESNGESYASREQERDTPLGKHSVSQSTKPFKTIPFSPKEQSKKTHGEAEDPEEEKEIESTTEDDTTPRFGPTMKPPYRQPKVCASTKPSCCVSGELNINLNKAKGKKSKEGKLDGVNVVAISKGQGRNKKQACSSNALITVDFEKIDQAGCFGCLEAPYCGKRMLKIEVKLSNARRGGWMFNIGDSESNNGYRGDSNHQTNDAETQAIFPNITVYPSDRCPTISSLMHIVDAVADGVDTVTLYVSNENIRITNSDGLDFKLCNKCLYALNGQPDSGPNGEPNERIYIGMNRVVKDLSRTGYGVCSARISWECPWCI